MAPTDTAHPATIAAPGPTRTNDLMRTRTRRRREPSPLDQLPAWRDLVPVMDPAISGTDPAGLAALLGGLDPDQLRAVTHGDGPLLVVAGAGTGKTQVITRRIAWLIATHRAKPSEILALTFTDKAADEMAVRVDQLVPYGYTDTAISTFHAFGDGLIREYALELGLPTDVRVLTRAEVVIFLREHLFEFDLDAYRPLGDPTRFLAALATLFSRCKDEDISPADYTAHADRVAAEAAALGEAAALAEASAGGDAGREAADGAAEDARRQTELARAFATYQSLLAANGCIDFGDQVALALRLVRTSAAARSAIAGRFRYILVDEFQDTNRAQAELVAALADRHRNVTVVGDDDQAIYAFRGAAIDNILDFQDRYVGARTVVLRRNYRSLAPILDAAYRLIRFNDPDRLEVRTGILKRLRAQRSAVEPTPVRLEVFATGSEEADWIAAEIGRRIEAGAAPRDHAVLVRANGHADPILRALNMAGIPWRFSGTSGLYARPEVRLLLAFLRVVADLDSSVDLYALAASEVYGLGGEDLTSIVNMARRRNRSVWAVLEELDRQPGILRLAPDTRPAVTRLVTDLRAYADAAHELPAGELLYRFLKSSGLLARLVGTDTPAAEEQLQNVARFFEIVRSRAALLVDDRAIFVAPYLATLIDAGDDPATAELDPDADAVAVLTVHKAKGLEFPVVFLPGMVAGRFPSGGRADPLALPAGLGRGAPPTAEMSLAEERRLGYVAMTRARDELVLSHAADYGGSRARRVSPFVLEALDLPAAAGVPGAGARASTPAERLAGFDVSAAASPVAADGPISDPLSLSFYQIDDYLTCPLKYKYAHVLRVPLAPHHAIVYGAALHKAVQLFHHRHAKGHVMSEAELDDVLDSAWSSEGFMSRDHEEARLAAGRAALRRFRLQQLEPDAVIPTYVEREFSFTLGGDRVRGRWDRVDVVPMEEGNAAVAAREDPSADVVSPTLDMLGPERVTITDYKSSDVRDPVKARQRARESLQLQIYAMGYEAMTGRLPDQLALHFLESGLVGTVAVDPKRLAKARERIAEAAAGMRARDYTPKPDYLACTWCAFRDICPSSIAR
ncbi:MAG TPA: ATP-dependent DNA helicase [Candidatus Limnocylindrales bacterium]|nr:ATP-dependent DNA helicase [Candidatus Limnocylindrales bacterium]